MADKNTIRNWFRTGLKPTQAQFWATWDSFWHKDEKIPITAIEDIENILNEKADAEAFDNHVVDALAHADLFNAKEDKNKRGASDGYAPLNNFTKLAIEYLNVVNDLVTGGADSLLTAEQGKVLKDQFNETCYKTTIAQIRALTGTLPNNDFYTTDLGQEGNWYYDASDTTSADNIGCVLVTSDGKRIKRVIQGSVNVNWFGAMGDAETDNTTAFQTACDYLASVNGGVLFIPYGRYNISNTIEVNSQILFLGEGSNSYEWIPNYHVNNNGSSIEINSSTLNLIETYAAGVSFQNIAITNLHPAPTAGTGIKMNSAGSFNMANVSVKNFYTNLEIKDGTRWSIEGSNFFFPKNRGIYIHSNTDWVHSDTGDTSISGSNIMIDSPNVTGIRFESSGGLKIVNSKINPSNSERVKYCLDVYVAGSSSILLLANSSFEGFSDKAINITTDGVHSYDSIIINGNQIESYSDALTCIEVQGNIEGIRHINIVNNTIKRNGPESEGPAILINGVTQANVSDNQIVGYKNRHIITNTPYIYSADGYGGTFKGQVGIGNNTPGMGYRGFSDKGIVLSEDLSGIVVVTDLDTSDNANVFLEVTGASDKPIISTFALGNFGNGSILNPILLNKGWGIDSAKACYLGGKLCYWIKPTINYSNFNFEIQTNEKVVRIVDRYVSAFPSGAIGAVDFVVNNLVLKNYTVGTLPTGKQGDTAYVTDAATPAYLQNVIGGGSVKCPVFYNGTAWVAH